LVPATYVTMASLGRPAGEIRLRAERRCGQIIADKEKAK
jgi:hypothetical protein